MARRRKDESSTPLFDLPLQAPDSVPAEPDALGQDGGEVPVSAPEPVPLFEEESPAPDPAEEPVEVAPEAPPEPRAMTVGDRLLAGIADLGATVGAGLLLALGARLLGAPLTLAVWPAWLLVLLAFSFLYSVVPLAFWGRTPGMLWRALVSRARDGGPLTFGQTARRWLGGVLTLALGGLPALLLPTGRSLADLLSGSMTQRD